MHTEIDCAFSYVCGPLLRQKAGTIRSEDGRRMCKDEGVDQSRNPADNVCADVGAVGPQVPDLRFIAGVVWDKDRHMWTRYATCEVPFGRFDNVDGQCE